MHVRPSQEWNSWAMSLHVKHIAARMHCLIRSAVYWHNVTSRDSVSPPIVPANKIYYHEVWVKGVDSLITSSGPGCSYYQVGNRVWFKMAQNRCTTKFGKGHLGGQNTPPRKGSVPVTQCEITGGRLWLPTLWERGRKPTVWYRRYRIRRFAGGRSCGITPSRAFA